MEGLIDLEEEKKKEEKSVSPTVEVIKTVALPGDESGQRIQIGGAIGGAAGNGAESSSVLRDSPVAVELFCGGTEVRMISLKKRKKEKKVRLGVLGICTVSGQLDSRLSPRWPDAACRVTIHLSYTD